MGGADSLAQKLDHDFARPELLERALTHPSAAPPGRGRRAAELSYERMEFLGDRVLGLALADILFHRFPSESEGEIARRLAKLANRDSLAAVARAIDLGSFVRMAEGEAQAGARANPAILADCCEAVLGAIYLDDGMAAAHRFIARAWETLIASDVAPPRDAKTALQEWAQARGLDLPDYRIVEQSGPAHAPEFTVEVALAQQPSTRGTGRSKREAEQAAADAMLARVTQTVRQAG
jgi:ribonuclease-3